MSPLVPGSHATSVKLLKDGVKSAPSDFSWCVLACEDVDSVLDLVAGHLTPEDSDVALSKLITAKSVWACRSCHAYDMESVLSGYTECSFCAHWYHNRCAEKMGVSAVTPFVCALCLSLQTADSLDRETVIVLPDDGTLEMSVAIINN